MVYPFVAVAADRPVPEVVCHVVMETRPTPSRRPSKGFERAWDSVLVPAWAPDRGA
ncbi:hypothetical protein GCM10010326_03000 [Streptomyces xanthochromogenes]|uniref:Uncharacterized protein n=1 Tax=Streptomyces xanthochromogenes TaxID=67384 RepID=A0ABQ2ZJD9_9ACTN|nr:hypothetical protein GCM10010326_03000 [Streptomyces xanthochromogenes]